MNTFIESNKGKHFTLSDRISIEAGIEKGWSFKRIADELGKSPSSVSREVRRHLIFSPHYYDDRSRRKTECIYFSSCSKQGVCGNLSCSSLCSKCRSRKCASFCPSFTTAKCELLKKPPYVCNACPKLRRCSHDFFFYRAKHSHDTSLELRSSSRSGINLSPEELDQLDRLVSPLIKKGQPLSHIFLSHMEDIPCCQRTLYSYVDKQYLSVINLDLPRKVRYKKRKKKQLDTPVPGYRKNRTYRDLLDFLASSPDASIVELDVVEGAGGKSGPVLLTLFFRNCSLMLLFLLPGDRRKYVQDVFDLLLSELGPQTYSQLFPIILTDNGSSFLDPSLFEMPHRQDVLTKVFYCDPMSSWQKGRLEKNHEFIRYILPKGTSFDSLTEQKVNLMMNHINSTARASLNGYTPFQLALLLLDAKLMSLMDLRSVPADQVHLKPDLIK